MRAIFPNRIPGLSVRSIGLPSLIFLIILLILRVKRPTPAISAITKIIWAISCIVSILMNLLEDRKVRDSCRKPKNEHNVLDSVLYPVKVVPFVLLPCQDYHKHYYH